ncbi:LysR family transcriptional regulator [Halobacillus litoralis]|uniref:LysR family transcriptional regulator n=1 Tax=Halobacillus litoralis TaxID=45668 RepID=A0A845EE61_9BACI|nr:LysR family transcriptional regulator [Halobacillus litoralis]MYL50001.1 LysR family transcriptional regulator [Halobacillus litoralis]
MNFDQLKYILEVSKERSLTKAAKNLHVSTPAISKAITQLEKEFGITIFNRTRQGTIPTLEGKKLIKGSMDILKKTEDLYKEFHPNQSKPLKIGCGPALTYVIYDAFLLFNKENPDIEVEIVEMDKDDILKALKDNEISIGFSQYDPEEFQRSDITESIDYDFLFNGYTCVCVSKHSPLYHKDRLTVEDIRNEKFVLYNSERVKAINELYVSNMNLLFTSNNIEVLRSAVLNGHAIVIVHNLTFVRHPDVLNGNLRVIPLEKTGLESYSFWGVRSKKSEVSPEAKEFQLKVLQACRL